jgi:Fe-S-cluster containining protein
MKLQVLHDERFSCKSCTDCCRRWYVELFEGEPEHVAALPWPKDDPLHGVKGVVQHGGKSYLAHRPDGACVFLNETNGLCRVHEQFGVDAKCLSCRMYPFQITPTFRGEASVSARYDCPTVRRNEGEPHAEALPLLRQYMKKGPPPEGFDEATRCGLDREQITAVAEFAGTLMGGFPRNDQRAMFIVQLSDLLALTAADDVNRMSLAGAFGGLKSQVESAAAQQVSRPGWIHRMAFRTLLALHLRRDEDILDRRASRFGRVVAMAAFVLGVGSFHGMGLHHRPGSLRQAKLFQSGPQPSTDTMALLWRLLRNKLDTFSFMGESNGKHNFLTGLRSLALLYPLVMAAARHNAAARGSTTIDNDDLDVAVAAIEHSFGRTEVLARKFVRTIENLLLERTTFARLARTI